MLRMASGAMALLALAGAAQAQPYGYYAGSGYAYRYAPPKAYDNSGAYTPYSYSNGYDYSVATPRTLAGMQGSPFVERRRGLGEVPFDQYGPDPNGLTAADGRRIKCKLRWIYDSASRRPVERRQCW